MYASEGGHTDIVLLLLKHGAEVNGRDSLGKNIFINC